MDVRIPPADEMASLRKQALEVLKKLKEMPFSEEDVRRIDQAIEELEKSMPQHGERTAKS